MTTIDYNQQALDFLSSTNTEFKVEFLKNDFHFADDKETRDIYKVTLKRGSRKFSFDFGQSLNYSGFYAKQGRSTFNLDRNWLALPKSKLYDKIYFISKIKFNPVIDTIHYPTVPDEYSVLACLQKYDVGTFEDFCGEFGYDTDSRTAKKTYKAVVKEYANVCKLFTDEEIEQLQEIQ